MRIWLLLMFLVLSVVGCQKSRDPKAPLDLSDRFLRVIVEAPPPRIQAKGTVGDIEQDQLAEEERAKEMRSRLARESMEQKANKKTIFKFIGPSPSDETGAMRADVSVVALDGLSVVPSDIRRAPRRLGRSKKKKKVRVVRDGEDDLDGLFGALAAAPPEAPEPAPVMAEVLEEDAAADNTKAEKAVARPGSAAGLKLDLGGYRGAYAFESEPPRFMPRMCYFENTYLGGNAAYMHRLRTLDAALSAASQPYRAARLPPQDFDAPADGGLRLTAQLDRTYVDGPGRAYLQIGLQGSRRFGWRRPPLDIVLVLDVFSAETSKAAAMALLKALGPQDRLAIVRAGVTLHPLQSPRDARRAVLRALDAPGEVRDLTAAMHQAGVLLGTGARDAARIPGAQTVLLLTNHDDPRAIASGVRAAHALSVQGAVTSVIEVGGDGAWWSVANAGHGNDHMTTDDPAAIEAKITEELASLSRVIARLLRLNIRLGPNVEAIRVVGSRVLGQPEVKRVKAREEATDRNLSLSMGLKADRGDDDDGVQTIIPYFYGGDSHVIIVELWVKSPGPVADITLKYKDMVKLSNATAQTSVRMARVARGLTPAQRGVRRNLRAFETAEQLAAAALALDQGRMRDALSALDAVRVRGDRVDVELSHQLVGLVQRGVPQASAALRMASARRLGHSDTQQRRRTHKKMRD